MNRGCLRCFWATSFVVDDGDIDDNNKSARLLSSLFSQLYGTKTTTNEQMLFDDEVDFTSQNDVT